MNRRHRKLLPVLVSCGWLGCTGSKPDSSVADLVPPPSVAEAAPAPVKPDPAPPSEVGDAILFGVLARDGKASCEGEETKWSELHYVAGFVRLAAGPSVEASLAEKRGEPVWIEGEIRGAASGDRGLSQRAGVHPCAPAQMRSDWLVRPDDMGMVRDQMSDVTDFEAQRVHALEGLEVELLTEGGEEKLRVRFTNPTGREIPSFRFRVHYEGCHGKPGTDRRESAPAPLAAGGVAEFVAPVSTQQTRGPGQPRATVARSVQLAGGGDGIEFDFDLPVWKLGVELDCRKH